MAETQDADLVQGARSGDRNAYGDLVTRYQGHVYGLAYSLVGNWANARDIAQETFIRAYMNLDQLREPAKFAAWLRRVTFSVAMNWLKAFRPALFQQLDGKVDLDHLEIPDFQPGPAELAEKRDLADAVLRAVAELPPKYRVALTMFHLDGLSYQKVADFLDIPLGTVKSIIHRAREKLRALLPAQVVAELAAVQEVFEEHKLPKEFAMKVLEGLQYKPRILTEPGCVEACLEYLGIDVSPAWLWGASGYAFFMNVADNFCPSSMFTHEFQMHRLGKNVGYVAEHVAGGKGEEQFAHGQERAWDTARKAIDDGFPCLAWEWEWLLVHGYGEAGYYVQGRVDDAGDGPLAWRKLGDTPVGWLALVVVRPGAATDDVTTVKQALEFAVEFWENPGKWTTRDRGGSAGYDQWIAALAAGHTGGEAGRTAAIHAQCRQYAAGFLREAKERLDSDLGLVFDEAIAHYDEVAQNLKTVSELFPYPITQEQEEELQARDEQRCPKAIECLSAAKGAEAAGVAALKKITSRL